jgi:hypothetical protein
MNYLNLNVNTCVHTYTDKVNADIVTRLILELSQNPRIDFYTQIYCSTHFYMNVSKYKSICIQFTFSIFSRQFEFLSMKDPASMYIMSEIDRFYLTLQFTQSFLVTAEPNIN